MIACMNATSQCPDGPPKNFPRVRARVRRCMGRSEGTRGADQPPRGIRSQDRKAAFPRLRRMLGVGERWAMSESWTGFRPLRDRTPGSTRFCPDAPALIPFLTLTEVGDAAGAGAETDIVRALAPKSRPF